MKTISARTLNQNVSAAKRMAAEEPVLITDRGKPSLVLMSHAEFERLAEAPTEDKPVRTLFDIFGDERPEADFEWEVPRLDWTPRPVDFD